VSNATRLLKSTELQPDESTQSVALRLASFCLTSVDELLRYGLRLNTKLSSLPNEANALKRLAEIGGYEPEEIYRRMLKWTSTGYLLYGRTIPYHWVDVNGRRLAPGVLSTDGPIPFHRLAWQVKALECDIETGEALTGRCPRCCGSLTWNNIESITVCGVCRFDMREHLPKYVPSPRLESARELHRFLLGANARLPMPFPHVDDITACFAMEWLGSFTADPPVSKPPQLSCQSAAAGLAGLRSWPQSFDDTIHRFAAECSAPCGPSGDRIVPSLVAAIQRAGTSSLRRILLQHATEILGSP
jgi:TniQ